MTKTASLIATIHTILDMVVDPIATTSLEAAAVAIQYGNVGAARSALVKAKGRAYADAETSAGIVMAIEAIDAA